MNYEQIASICHAANRAYCERYGDFSHKPWGECSAELRLTTTKGVEFAVNNPTVTSREIHANWSKDKISQGWKYGPVKDSEKKEHPCLTEYDNLPEFDRKKDELFLAIVGVLSRSV